jgi:hypothetical protein
MGLLDLFRKDEVTGSKVLVCSLGPKFDDSLKSDSQVYKRFYPATTSKTLTGIQELTAALAQKFDIVHLLCDVSPEGAIAGMSGTELIKKCCEADVKLLWIASNNLSDAYIKGFNARGQKINLVMIKDRQGPFFSPFLTNLLAKLSSGEAMPAAWNQLCPQVPSSVHPDAPEAIFFAGRGGVRLR